MSTTGDSNNTVSFANAFQVRISEHAPNMNEFILTWETGEYYDSGLKDGGNEAQRKEVTRE